MSRRWQRAVVVGACCLLGVSFGLGLGLGLRSSTVSAGPVSEEKRAADLLGCYAYRLSQFADVATQFSQARFEDTKQLREHAAPLKAAITATNASYSAIEQTSLQLILGLQRSARRTQLGCQLQKAEGFQWRRYRPALNALLVNVIIAWQHDATEAELDRIRGQQKEEWPAFARTMLDGQHEFRDEHGAKPTCQ